MIFRIYIYMGEDLEILELGIMMKLMWIEIQEIISIFIRIFYTGFDLIKGIGVYRNKDMN